MSGTYPWEIRVTTPGKVILHGEHSVVYGKTGVVVSIDLRTSTLLRLNDANKKCMTINLPDLNRRYNFGTESLRQFLRTHSNHLLDASSTEFDEGSFIALKEAVSAYVEKIYPDLVVQNCHDKALHGITATLFLYFAILYESGRGVEPLYLETSSVIPIGAGLGSSAAYSVSIAAALCCYYSKNYKVDEYGSSFEDSASEDSSKHSSPARNDEVPLEKQETRMRKEVCKWAFLAEKILHGNPSGMKLLYVAFSKKAPLIR